MEPLVLAASIPALLLYLNTLGAEFAYDDSRAIKTNPDVSWTSPWWSLVWNDFWGTPLTHSGSHKSYRPLTVLTYRLNHLFGELDPLGYHVVNVFLHFLATALFGHLASRLFRRRAVPTLVATFTFAVHPIHTEAVAGIVGRADILASIFFLLALRSYMAYLDLDASDQFKCDTSRTSKLLKRWWFLSLTVLSAFLSMLSKEHGLTVLGVCAVTDLLLVSRLRLRDLFSSHIFERGAGSSRGVQYEGVMVLVVGFLGILALRLSIMGAKTPEFSPADNPAADSDSVVLRTLTFFYLPVFNFFLLLMPAVLSFDWSMDAIPPVSSPWDVRAWLSAFVYLLLLYWGWGILDALQRRKEQEPERVERNGSTAVIHAPLVVSHGFPWDTLDVSVMGLALLLFPFVPASNLFFYVGFVVAERVLYIPSMGYCLLLALGFHLLQSKTESVPGKRILHLALVGLLLLFSVRTLVRNRDWASEESLYRSGILVNPPKAYGNLANILSAQGNKEDAERAYKLALSYRSNMADVHYNLGILYQETKRYEEAIQSYRLAIQFRPRMAMAHLNLGLVLGLLDRKEEAMEVYLHCSTLDVSGLKDPRTHEATKVSALFNLGRLYADESRLADAIRVYMEAVNKMPPHYQAQSLYNMLGEAHFKKGDLNEAEKWYLEALKAKPDHVPAHLTYGKLLAKLNRVEEADALFQRALKLVPEDSTVHQHYGQFLSERDRAEEAARHYVKAAESAPSEYEIIFNAANTLRQAGRNQDAEAFYRKAVQLRPTEATSHLNLGAMLHVNGKLEAAEESYLAALRLKPDDPITKTNLQKLRQLQGKKSKGGSSER